MADIFEVAGDFGWIDKIKKINKINKTNKINEIIKINEVNMINVVNEVNKVKKRVIRVTRVTRATRAPGSVLQPWRDNRAVLTNPILYNYLRLSYTTTLDYISLYRCLYCSDQLQLKAQLTAELALFPLDTSIHPPQPTC